MINHKYHHNLSTIGCQSIEIESSMVITGHKPTMILFAKEKQRQFWDVLFSKIPNLFDSFKPN